MKWDKHSVVAVILAAGVAGSIVILSVGELFHNGHITDTEATTIATILGAGIGAIATFLGGRDDNGGDDKHD